MKKILSGLVGVGIFACMIFVLAVVSGWQPKEEAVERIFSVEIPNGEVSQADIDKAVSFQVQAMTWILWVLGGGAAIMGLLYLLAIPKFREVEAEENVKAAQHARSLRDVQEQKYQPRTRTPSPGTEVSMRMPVYRNGLRDRDKDGWETEEVGIVIIGGDTPLEKDGKSDWLG